MNRLYFVLATVGALIAVLVAMPASEDVARYQTQAGTLTISLEPAYQGNIHVFDITVNPCDGAFTGTTAASSPVAYGETISGTFLNGTLVDFLSTYSTGLPGYQWFDDGPGHAADLYLGNPLTPRFAIAVTTALVNTSDWKNHGQYVKSNPDDKNTAAHSCLGMPITP